MSQILKVVVVLTCGACSWPLAAQSCDPIDVFTTVESAPSDGQTQHAVIGDFNEDGFPDIVGRAGSAFSIELGNGDGTFQEATHIEAPLDPPASGMGAFDINNDGHLDVIALSGNIPGQNSSVRVILGAGDGSFTVLDEEIVADDNTQTGILTMADLNDDGNLDLLMTIDLRLYIVPGLGDGTFGAFEFISGIDFPRGVAAADLNGDGLPDIAVADFFVVRVYLNRDDSPGDFLPAVHYDKPDVSINDIAMVDINADGNLDVLMSGLGVLLGNGNGTLQPFFDTPSPPGGSSSTKVADFDGDGNLDVAGFGLRIAYGVGDGTFDEIIDTPPDGALAAGPLVADLDLDGDVDVVFKGNEKFDGVNRVFINECSVAPQIVSQPEALTFVDAGADVTLEVEIGIGTPPITYQWRRDGVDLVDGGHISGATTTTLQLAGVTFADTNLYDIIVSNDIGSATSDTAVVSVRQSCYPDCNGDGVLNILDFVCFQGQFQGSCP